MKSAIITVPSTGIFAGGFELPGGYCGRIVSGSPGITLPFPLAGFIEDDHQTKIVLLDNGPHPFVIGDPAHGGVATPRKIVFPAGTLPGGTIIAYYVAESAFEAALMQASGLQFAQDSSGRVVVIPADFPTKATYQLNNTLALSPAFIALQPAAKKVRLRRLRIEWPGKQTTGAKATLQLWLDKSHIVTGTPINTGNIQAFDPASDSAASSVPVSGGTLPSGTATLIWNGVLFVPGADAAFTPIEYDLERPMSGQKPPIVPVGGLLYLVFGAGALGPGAGFDSTTSATLIFTEE